MSHAFDSVATPAFAIPGARHARPDLTGKVALVTGSSKGIGRAIAEAFVRSGARVTVSSRTAADVKAAAAELNEIREGAAVGIPCDVRDPKACRALVEGTVAEFGGLDLLVNNAGLGIFAPLQEMDPADWDVQIRTNLDGVFHCSKAAVPHLIARAAKAPGEAWILNIGSLAGRNAFSGGVAYNATKFGLTGMTEAMMLDLRHEGVRVSCIMPGSVNTHFFEGGPDPEADWKLTGEDIAGVVLDLVAFPPNALPSKVEIRPARPPKK
ncbi:MAG: SDR family oxidoreductase [Gemmatimonadales bacterium]|nr:MAG: SDR family oxidoreductase [Gemmatimonadales bacterium]